MMSRQPSRRALPVVGAVLLGLASACAGPQKPAIAPPPPPVAAPPVAPPRAPQESLRDYIPERAVAALVLRRHALAPLRALLDQDPALHKELSGYLRQSLGVDLTELAGAVAFLTSVEGSPRGALVLRLPSGGALKRPADSEAGAPLPPHLDVPLLRLSGEVVAASLPGALLLGTADAVREAIAVHKRLATPLSAATPLGALLSGDPQLVDLEVAVTQGALRDPGLQEGLARFGVRGGSLTYQQVGGARLRLAASGDPDKLTLAKGLLMIGIEAGLKELESKKEAAKLGSDVAKAAGLISVYHMTRRLAQELEPRLVGDQLVVQYQVPETMRGGFLSYLGVMSAVAIPAFEKYLARSKAAAAGPPPAPPKRGL